MSGGYGQNIVVLFVGEDVFFFRGLVFFVGGTLLGYNQIWLERESNFFYLGSYLLKCFCVGEEF